MASMAKTWKYLKEKSVYGSICVLPDFVDVFRCKLRNPGNVETTRRIFLVCQQQRSNLNAVVCLDHVARCCAKRCAVCAHFSFRPISTIFAVCGGVCVAVSVMCAVLACILFDWRYFCQWEEKSFMQCPKCSHIRSSTGKYKMPKNWWVVKNSENGILAVFSVVWLLTLWMIAEHC